MTDTGDRTLEQALASLRDAAGELRTALAARVAPSEDDGEVTRQLKADTVRLGQAASHALSALGRELDQQRGAVGSAAERERAEKATSEIKGALSELTEIAATVAGELASAASAGVRQVDPEITKAISALDDVINSATTWIREAIESNRGRGQTQASRNTPPLDDL